MKHIEIKIQKLNIDPLWVFFIKIVKFGFDRNIYVKSKNLATN